MDRIAKYRQIIKDVITKYAQFYPAYGTIDVETIFDEAKDHYEMMYVGWQKHRRVHGCVLHIDIRGGKVWIQHDGTEDGVAEELVEAGIPRDHIILAFHPEDVRQYTDYAIA
ncbi:MAG: XisI protein [Chloroflexi bacterium]|nr:XisI protein [Chloroflexota bacterium]